MSKPSTNSIPVYRADGTLWDVVSERRFARLQFEGQVARIVRHRKGQVNRAILFARPGEPKPLPDTAYAGTKYSFRERLEHGLAWELRRLGGVGDGKTYAPPETRAIFLRVVTDCLVTPPANFRQPSLGKSPPL